MTGLGRACLLSLLLGVYAQIVLDSAHLLHRLLSVMLCLGIHAMLRDSCFA